MKRVYFIRPIGLDGPVKIGCSIACNKRFATILTWSPLPLEMAASIEGGHDLEAALHHRFAHLALHGEWFGVDDELLSVIEDAKAGRPVTGEPLNGRSTSRVASTLKGQLSRRISDAEVMAHGFRLNQGEGRPADVCAIMAAYQGPGAPPPSPADQAVLTKYITGLRARPRAARHFADRWRAWEEYRSTGVLPGDQPTRKSQAVTQ